MTHTPLTSLPDSPLTFGSPNGSADTSTPREARGQGGGGAKRSTTLTASRGVLGARQGGNRQKRCVATPSRRSQSLHPGAPRELSRHRIEHTHLRPAGATQHHIQRHGIAVAPLTGFPSNPSALSRVVSSTYPDRVCLRTHSSAVPALDGYPMHGNGDRRPFHGVLPTVSVSTRHWTVPAFTD